MRNSSATASDAWPGWSSAGIARPRQKVCVQGLGFVGAAMTAVLTQTRDRAGRATFDVVGLDLPTPQGLERIGAINAGRFPFTTTDPELDAAISDGRRCGNISATADAFACESADIVIVDVHLDVDFDSRPPIAKLDGIKRAIRTLGERVRPGTLIIIETTVPPGTTENVVVPLLQEGLSARGLDPNCALVAHSFERVMPGRNYLRSITNMWRVYSGVTEEAADACEAFLKKIINTADFPLTRLKRPIESETAKLMENSFRATNIAFIEEWARFAERAGVNLGAVIGAIRERPTHRNIMRPGFGVGGYCLTKDPLLLGVGARDILGLGDLSFPFCEAAVDINLQMPRATLGILRTALGGLGGKRILLLGASYREDVADTRYSPSTSFTVWAEAEGAKVDVQDPLVDVLQDIGRPVRREVHGPDSYHAVVFAVAHEPYRRLRPANWLGRERPLIVDANMVLSPGQLRAFCHAGCRVKVIGRGDL
jgi:UDP-N-acetyl-D-glucosamine dehydrogenase